MTQFILDLGVALTVLGIGVVICIAAVALYRELFS